jgi:hypothetical protein
MVSHRGVAPLAIDAERDAASALEFAPITAQEAPQVEYRTVLFARIENFK